MFTFLAYNTFNRDIKTVRNPPPSFTSGLAAVAIFALAGYAIFSFTVLQGFTQEKKFIYNNIYGLRDRASNIESMVAELQQQVITLQKDGDQQKIETSRHFAQQQSEYVGKIGKLSDQINNMKTLSQRSDDQPQQGVDGVSQAPADAAPEPKAAPAAPAKEDALLLQAVDYLMSEATNATPSADSRKPVSFASVTAGTVVAGRRYDGGRGTDTLNLGLDGDIVLDGSKFVSFESINLANDKANTISVLAPGLNNLENDKLEVLTDPKLDKLVLDGCLAWKHVPDKHESATHQSAWTATDSDKQTRQLFVTLKTPVSIGKCDNRYAYLATKRNFPAIWLKHRVDSAKLSAE